MNKFIITGRISKKPELLSGENYNKVHLNVACDKTVKNGDNYEKSTAWNSVTVFGKAAENCAKYLEKGQHVICEGTIENVKKDDSYVTYLTASKVEFGAKAASSNNQEPKEDPNNIPF